MLYRIILAVLATIYDLRAHFGGRPCSRASCDGTESIRLRNVLILVWLCNSSVVLSPIYRVPLYSYRVRRKYERWGVKLQTVDTRVLTGAGL